MSDPTEELLKIIKDEKKEETERARAAYIYGLLMFAEPIDDHTVRITSETQDKLNTYRSLLRLIEDRKET